MKISFLWITAFVLFASEAAVAGMQPGGGMGMDSGGLGIGGSEPSYPSMKPRKNGVDFNSMIAYSETSSACSSENQDELYSHSDQRYSAGVNWIIDRNDQCGLNCSYERMLIDSSISFPDSGLKTPDLINRLGIGWTYSSTNKHGTALIGGQASQSENVSINSIDDFDYSMMVGFRFPTTNHETYSANFMFGNIDGMRNARPIKDYGETEGDSPMEGGGSAVMGSLEAAWDPNPDFRATINLHLMMMGLESGFTAGLADCSVFYRPTMKWSLNAQFSLPESGQIFVDYHMTDWMSINASVGDQRSITPMEEADDMEGTLCCSEWAIKLGLSISPIRPVRLSISGGYLFYRALNLEYLIDDDLDGNYDDMESEDADMENIWQWNAGISVRF